MTLSRFSRRPREAPSRFIRRPALVAAIFAATVLLADGVIGEKGLIETMRATKENQRVAEEIARLRQENATLREEARRLREDPEAVEDLARRELGLIRRGEKLFTIKDVDPSRIP